MSEFNQNIVSIQNFAFGGLADSLWSGPPNSLYKLIGFDLHSMPGILRVAQKMTLASEVPDEFIKAQIVSTNGKTYHFSSESGKIWQESGGTFTLVYTTVATGGSSGCLGAREYRGTIYWATEDYLHKIVATDAEGSAEWTANATPNWKLFTNGDTDYHPMTELGLILYIGDGNLVAQVDDAVFTPDALDIEPPLRVSCLGKMGVDLLIGTYVSDNVTETQIFRWNTYSVSFYNPDSIPEVGIHAFLPFDNFVLVYCGYSGNLYFYNGEVLELWKKIPGDYDSTNQAKINTNAVASIGGVVLFGLSKVAGDPADLGVYSIGRYSKDYPYVMDFPYPISERDDDEFVLSNIEIGSILVKGNDVFVSWRRTNGATITSGVDKLDHSNKLSGAYFETKVTALAREQELTAQKFIVPYHTLPDGTEIQIYYSQLYGAYTQTTTLTDTQRGVVEAQESPTASLFQLKVKLTASSNTAPEIESAAIFLT